jgi:3-dehydroquinate synthetase
VNGPSPPAVVGSGRVRALGTAFEYPEGRAFLVSSPGVMDLHGAAIRSALSFRSFVEILVDDREIAKTLRGVEGILEAAIASEVRRDDFVVAFGGGVVSDMAGFAASVLLRGIRWYGVPTTLLAMADAAIGGKTGVDHPAAKNQIGTFHFPSGVLVDPDFLETLPERAYRSGLAEIYKALLVGDAEGAEEMRGRLEELARLRGARRALLRAIAVKERIVREDPFESDRRRVLNFGHTLGHALETAGAYRDLAHGEAVALGMAAALLLSSERSGYPEPDARAQAAELSRFARAGRAPELCPSRDAIRAALRRDKKNTAGRAPAVLLSRPGAPVIADISDEEWLDAAERILLPTGL